MSQLLGEPKQKTPMAVFVTDFLPQTCTFIYRQLKGVEPEFAPIVLTERRINEDLFPWNSIIAARQSTGSFVLGSLLRKAHLPGNRFAAGGTQLAAWKQALRDCNAKLIHAQFGTSGLRILPIARQLGIPMIVTFRGRDASTMLRRRVYRQSLGSLFKYAWVLTVSNHIRDRLLNVGASPERTTRHVNGVPVERFPFIERESLLRKLQAGRPIRVIQVGGFVEKKGQPFTIEAFARLTKKYPQLRLTFIGDGPRRAACHSLCEQLGIQSRVTFEGALPDTQVADHLERCDLFVHPSVVASDGDEEGIPNAILEAMSSGLPVIATPHGGIPEAIQHGQTGYLTPERDIDEYVSTFETALNAQRCVGRAARKFVVENFNLERQNRRLVALYQQLLNSPAYPAGVDAPATTSAT